MYRLYIPKTLQKTTFRLSLFASVLLKKTPNRAGSYSSFSTKKRQKSSRPKPSPLKYLGYIGLYFFMNSGFSQAELPFKSNLNETIHWGPYLSVLLILFLLLLALNKFGARFNSKSKNSHLITTLPIYNKTKAYVLEYEGQRFLIAENQNAIAIHALKNKEQL